jgi:hypothetical protein
MRAPSELLEYVSEFMVVPKEAGGAERGVSVPGRLSSTQLPTPLVVVLGEGAAVRVHHTSDNLAAFGAACHGLRLCGNMGPRMSDRDMGLRQEGPTQGGAHTRRGTRQNHPQAHQLLGWSSHGLRELANSAFDGLMVHQQTHTA